NNNIQYPAKQLRITDLINTLTARASYPVRASGADSQERLGITDDKASRITVSGSTGQPMLELLAGSFDTTGQNIFLRKSGSNDIRSGEDKFSPYLSGGLTSWYNLRLIPETQDNKLDIDKVQRLTVYTSVQDSSVQPLVLTRDKNGWTSNQGDAVALDTEKVNTYVRGVLFTEGDDFSSEYKNDDPMFNSSQIVIELGDRSASAGNIRTIKLSAAEGDKRFATVSGSASDSDFVYSIPGWAANKLFTTVDQLKAEPKPAPAPAGNAANPQPGDASAVPIPPQPAPGAPPYSH
ncbi:MAG: DUF4340 domain-containing protein, partial [Treponema sp.]|nr:DUF4340 domain-containing protein [Treponema sp.]